MINIPLKGNPEECPYCETLSNSFTFSNKEFVEIIYYLQ